MATKKKKKPVKKPPLQVKLQEEASIRLKAFIEDLRHDPLFRHRLFYPVLYKQTIYKQEHASYQKNKYKGVSAPVAQVIYEYYLFKMERFGDKSTAKIFLAILLANGPMLPKEHRFYFKDANAKDSLLNRSNVETIFKRTKVFIEVLQDENLYNFIFRTTIGKNLEDMRKRFYELTIGDLKRNNININNIQISKNINDNLRIFHKYFKYINDKNIIEVVHFLTHMGEPRNIISDFSYRPLSLDELNKYRDYIMGYDRDENDIIYKTQLEYAFNSNVLQKDLNSQLDTFIPIIAKEYMEICKKYGDNVCGVINNNNNNFKFSRELENSIKLKLQRTLKRIHDYTYNYISRKLLNENYDDKLFISRLFSIIIEKLQQNQSITDILRNSLTFTNFVGSKEPDLADLIKSMFKSDIEYLFELCSDKRHCQNGVDSFFSRWDTQNEPFKKVIKKFKNKLDSEIFENILSCLKNNVNKSEELIKNLKKVFNEIRKAMQKNYRTTNIDYDENTDYDKLYIDKETVINIDKYEELLEKAAEDTKKDFAKLMHNFNNDSLLDKLKNLFNLSSNKNGLGKYESFYQIFYYIFLTELVYEEIKKTKELIENEDRIDQIYLLLKNIVVINNIVKYIIDGISNKDKLLTDCFDFIYENLRAVTIIDVYKELEPIKVFINDLLTNINDCISLIVSFAKKLGRSKDISQFMADFDVGITHSSEKIREINMEGMASALLMIYFKYYLRPVLISFFSYAFDNFEYTSRQDEIKFDIVSKDMLHLSKILDPRTTGILTFDGAVINDLTKLTYILLSDTFSGITYNNPDSVIEFLHKVYGIRYFNVFIYGKKEAYVYLNSAGVIYSYKGIRTKIPIKDLKNNYDFLMDPNRGLYKNIILPKKRR